MTSVTDKENITMEDVISAVKTFEVADLLNLLKVVASEAEMKIQSALKDVTPAKKTGQTGVIPPQLKKPRAWIEFTLKHALENGWEPFTIFQKKKDKETSVITEEQIKMPGSIHHGGKYIYKDSITEKTPQGRQIIHREAMSLSKQRKDNHHPTYAEFETTYVDESKPILTQETNIVVKKEVTEKITTEPVIKKEVTEKITIEPATTKRSEIPNDGMLHLWTYNGKQYLRNCKGETWTVGADGRQGAWVGWTPATW